MFKLRSVLARLPSWHATGLVEKAWRRIKPPRRDELARRMGVEGSDLSARNTSTDMNPRRMTMDYAKRIAAAVRQDDPNFSVADLGAPSSVVAEVDPTVLDRLEELAKKLADSIARQLKTDQELLSMHRRLSVLEAANEPGASAPKGSQP